MESTTTTNEKTLKINDFQPRVMLITPDALVTTTMKGDIQVRDFTFLEPELETENSATLPAFS